MHVFIVAMVVYLFIKAIVQFVNAGKTDDGAYIILGLMNLGLAIWGIMVF